VFLRQITKSGAGLILGLWRRVSRPEKVAAAIAMAVAMIAVAALLGWGVGNVTLTSVLAGSLALQPSTAIALLVGVVGLLAGAAGQRWLSQLAGAILLAACAVWLAAYASPHPLPTDLMLFRAPVLAQTPPPPWPGRPSIVTCIVMGLFAASLLGVGQHRPGLRLAAVTAASLGGLLAILSILPFLLQDASQLAILHQSLRISLNASIALGGLCAAVLILKRNTGWVQVVSGGGERARIARLLTPVALIPIVFATLARRARSVCGWPWRLTTLRSGTWTSPPGR
jgi:hypothetical protein